MSGMPLDYFEHLYASHADPWELETRWYERRKYDLCMAALPCARYRFAFEPGCSVGVLTEALATRCEQVLAGDIIASTVERARARLACRHNVRVEQLEVPKDWPAGESFDLVVLSELAYYFDAATLDQLACIATGSLEHGGTMLAAHWRGETNYPLSGDEAHRRLGASKDLTLLAHYEQVEFVLDVWRRR